MQIVHGLGGMKLRDAYSLIKNISKKKHDKIEKERPKFVEGAQSQGLTKSAAEDLFELILKFAGYGFNKCVVGETIITDAGSGERTTVGDLFRRRRPFTIHAVDAEGKLRARRVTGVVWNGCKPVFGLKTRQGKTITATGNHPFLTLDGWKNLDCLKPGDRVGAPRRLPVVSDLSWPEHELITLAGLLSEGNTCHPSCLYFFGNDRRLVDDFAAAAGKFPDSVARTYARDDGRRLEVCVSTGRDARFKPGAPRPSATADGPGGAGVAVAPAVRSGAFRWAGQLGLLGVKATAKRVPDEAFRLRDDNVALLLGRLWAGDGYIAGRSSSTPFYATSSRVLARDVQTLLLRLGILSGIHAKSFRYRDSRRAGYTVHLLGEGSIETFLRLVAPHCLGRERQVAMLQERVSAAAPDRTSKDTVPAEVRSWVDGERRRAGLTWRRLEAESGVCVRELCRVTPGAKRGFRRSTVRALARFFSSKRLAHAAESDVFWDEVVAIEPMGFQDVFDLTVEADHNFVADGLIVHNSHSTGYAIVAYQTAYLKTYFPNQYMAAFLTFESGAQKVSDWIQYVEDCKRARFTGGKVGVEVRPPDVNKSKAAFSVVFDEGEPRDAQHGHVRFGLGAIKGVGEKAIETIIAERDRGSGPPSGPDGGPSAPASPVPFTSVFDFCERVLAAGASNGKAGGGSGGAALNKTTLEALIKCGAMDGLHGRDARAAMLAAVEPALGAAQKIAADKAAGQGGLFMGAGPAGGAAGSKAAAGAVASLPKVAPWSEAQTLEAEKAALGFYVSSHPLERHRRWASVFVTATTETAKQVPQDGRVVMACLVQSVRTLVVKSGRSAGQKMAIVVFEDTAGTVEAVMFSDCYAQFSHHLTPDNVVFLLGRVDRSRSGGGGGGGGGGQRRAGGDDDAASAPAENTPQIVVDRIVPIEGVPLMPGRLWLLIDGNRLNGSGESAVRSIADLVLAGAGGGSAGRGQGVNGTMPDRTATFPIDLVIDTPAPHPQRVRLEAGGQLRIQPTPELVARIADHLGEGCIRVVGGVAVEAVKSDRPKWQGKRPG